MSTIKITDPERLEAAINKIREIATKYLEEGSTVIEIKQASKEREMKKKYHAMIGDISKQVTFYKGKKYNTATWKTQLIEQFATEMREMGKPLTHDSKTIPSLDGLREIIERPSSTDFKVKESSNFIEYLYATGAEFNVAWSEHSLRAYESYKEMQ
jgi:hypothetical protein|tara:strand:- start:19 stop:486 length:468 start_codon:yes stop_codon:yes gene_type:complete